MKVGKIWIVMVLVALGFQVNAQRATFVHEYYNSVRQYIQPLRLSQNQVADWSRLNRATDFAITDIERNRRMSPRAKAKHIENVLARHDRRLRSILSRRQLSKFYSMRSNVRGNRYYTPRRGNNYCPANDYDLYRQENFDRNRRRNNNRNDNRNYDRSRDNRDSGYYGNSSYYDGGRAYRS